MKLLLHIGQAKTGSSYVQSALSLAASGDRDALATAGVAYPIAPEIAGEAAKGRISSGNFWPRDGALEAVIAAGRATGLPALLISSEAIFGQIAQAESRFLEALRGLCPDAELRVLCYLRDPLDHAVSGYQQRVKRGGFAGTLADTLNGFAMPDMTVRALSRLRAAGAEVTIYNYSRHADRLLESFEHWLGLPGGTLPTPPTGRINRSLTRAELALQKAFNAHLGARASRLISDPLCNELPDLASEAPLADRDALAAFLERMARAHADPAYCDLVPAAERPRVADLAEAEARFAPQSAAEAGRGLTPAQMAVVAASVAAELGKLDQLRTDLRNARAREARLRRKIRRLRAGGAEADHDA